MPPTNPGPSVPSPSVVCVGESMAVLVADGPGPLRSDSALRLTFGGAESNTAMTLATLGHSTAWISRVGADDLGRSLTAVVRSGGVDTSAVVTDPRRPTGLYLRQPGGPGGHSRSSYYRRGSAASALGPDLLRDPRARRLLAGAEIVHLTGITAALSDSCLALLRNLLARPRRYRVSFDLNWRPALWQDRDPSVLRHLLDEADLVLMGADEAALALGTGEPGELRALLPSPGTLIVKDAEHHATAVERDGTSTTEPSLHVDVVEPTGAGDAFAAGCLAGVLRGLDARRRLRLGHLAAAAALSTPDDFGTPPPPPAVATLLHSSPEDWAATTVTAAGIGTSTRAADQCGR
ncbi:sugar kinase [Streptomyces scabichelini]|nr:sugar kinase [Streptomyces scabichelini]